MKNSGIILLGGFIIGFVSGTFAAKTYYKNKYENAADKEIEEMKEYYVFNQLYSPNNSDDEIKDYEQYVNEPEEAANRKENLKKRIVQKENLVSYNKMYENDENIKNGETITIEDKANESHEENKNKPPTLISEEELGELPPNINSQTLYLYTGDGTITDDCDNVIDEPSYLFGKVLDNVDLNDPRNSTIFVLNYELDTCYEIQIIEGDHREYEPKF